MPCQSDLLDTPVVEVTRLGLNGRPRELVTNVPLILGCVWEPTESAEDPPIRLEGSAKFRRVDEPRLSLICGEVGDLFAPTVKQSPHRGMLSLAEVARFRLR